MKKIQTQPRKVALSLTKPKKEGMMSKLKWFNKLKVVFDSFSNEYVNKQFFRAGLLKVLQSFPLITPKVYKEKTSQEGLSANQILTNLSELPEFFVWDQLLGMLIQSSSKITERPIRKKKGSQLPINRSIFLYQKSNRENIEFKYLNLANRSLKTFIKQDLDKLVLINLSNNRLESLSLPAPNLLQLNISNNILNKILLPNNRNLQEVYASDNSLNSVDFFTKLENLVLLDLSKNKIELYQSLASLARSKKLMIFKLKGNPISSQQDYKQNILNIQSKISVFDPSRIEYYSKSKHLNILFANQEEKIGQDSPVLSISEQEINQGSQPQITPEKINLTQSVSVELKNRVSSYSPKERNLGTPVKSRIIYPKSWRIGKNSSRIASATRARPSSAVKKITNSSIQQSQKLGFGNPVSSMMIKPPRVNRK